MKQQDRYICILVLIFCFCYQQLPAQQFNLGIPQVRNFFKSEYRAGTQNWDIEQDSLGRMYVANNNGVLTYNGQDWQLHPLPNATVVRSIGMDAYRNRLYAGGQDEIGYFQADKQGRLVFHDLKPLIPEQYRQFEDVWQSVCWQKQAFFRASDHIYHLNEKDSVQVFHFDASILYLGKVKQSILLQVEGKGLYTFDGTSFQPSGPAPFPKGAVIMASLPAPNGETLFCTERHGFFTVTRNGELTAWKTTADDWLKNKRVLSAVRQPDGSIAIGSMLGGLLILEPDGMVRQLLDSSAGLQNNTIRNVFSDDNENLWLGLDNGIDYVESNAPFSRVFPDDKLEGAGYAITAHEGFLYAGTPNGLYKTPVRKHYDPLQKEQAFSLVAGSAGQVWGLFPTHKGLLIGHQEGAFQLANSRLEQISRGFPGYWNFIPHPSDSTRLLAGTYRGVQLLQKTRAGWQPGKQIKNFQESSRFLAANNTTNAVWVSHPYRGLFRIQLAPNSDSAQVTQIGTKQGLPDSPANYVFPVRDQLMAATQAGIFVWNNEQQQFIAEDNLNALLSENEQMLRLYDDGNRIWYISNQDAGFFEIKALGLEQQVRRFSINGIRSRLLAGFENLYVLDDNTVFFGTDKGFLQLNIKQLQEQKESFHTLINRVNLIADTDSIVYGGYAVETAEEDYVFNHQEDAFRFSFAATAFSPFLPVEYQYKLDGLDDHWSDWTTKNEREYTNLRPGNYSFRVQARYQGQISEEQTFAFRVQPPWYASRWAILSYLAAVITLLVLLILIPRKRYEREKQALQEQHEETVAASEKTITELQKDKLESEVAHKNKELASTTMHLMHKSELINKLHQQLKKLSSTVKGTEAAQPLREILRELREEARLDEDWEHFFFHFDQVHEGFLKKLREQYPTLTTKDQQLCAYLRMNLTTKEIAPLMNISVRGVEISRYRLRKKLELDTEINLNDFMQRL